MIRSAILTDIHANRDALNAALDDIARRSVDHLIFLGDYIGGGPDIAPVLERVEAEVARGAIALRGNHDRTQPTPSGTLNPSARRIVDWTVGQLTARHRLFLDDLPLQAQWGGVHFTHASPHAPQDWYPVTDCASAAQGFAGSALGLMICGHARKPALYSLSSAGDVRAEAVPLDHPIELDTGAQWLAVVGPVGGSVAAEGGNAAQYCLLETSEKDKRAVISYHRAPYDGAAVLRRARAAGMPSVLMR